MAKIKVLMIGGKRCGKTTVLAKIRSNFNQVLHHDYDEGNDLFTLITPPDKIAHLNDAENSVIQLFHGNADEGINPYGKFIINDNVTKELSITQFKLSPLTKGINREGIEIEFTDIPGEWCGVIKGNKDENSDKLDVVTNLVQESQVIIIAIDTPSLCEEDGFYAEFCNRGKNITDAIMNAVVGEFINDPLAQKLILFVPLKCEKEIIKPDGTLDCVGMTNVNKKVKSYYKNLIDKLSHGVYSGKITMAIMPISTIKEIRWIQFKRVKQNKETDVWEEMSIHYPNGCPIALDYAKDNDHLASYYQFRPNLLDNALIHGPGSELCEQPLIYILVYTMQYSLYQRATKVVATPQKGVFNNLLAKVAASLRNTWQKINNAFVNNNDLVNELSRLRYKKMRRSNGVEILQNPLNM